MKQTSYLLTFFFLAPALIVSSERYLECCGGLSVSPDQMEVDSGRGSETLFCSKGSESAHSKRKHDDSDDEGECSKYSVSFPASQAFLHEVNSITALILSAWENENNDARKLFLSQQKHHHFPQQIMLNPYYEDSVRKLQRITVLIPSEHFSFRQARTLLQKIWSIDPSAGAREEIIPFN